MSKSVQVDIEKARELATGRIDQLDSDLNTKVNKVLHANPELFYKEFIAHNTLSSYLENLAYGRLEAGLEAMAAALDGKAEIFEVG